MHSHCSLLARLARNRIGSLLVLWALVSVRAVEAKDKGKAPPKIRNSAEYDALFSGRDFPHIRIEISTNGIETLQKSQWQFGQQPERESVTATVREGDHVYAQVALHLKGAAGSFRSIDDKPAFTLNFDKHAKGQHFHGLRKLSLNNSVQDPTYLSEQFCRELFIQAGIPTPRATAAQVELNGRDLGLYVLVEGWDREFLQRHFKDASGTLYDGGFVKDITDPLAVNSGKDVDNQADRKKLADAVKESDLARRLERLNEVLDVDRFLTFMALDVMLWDWDGYAMNKNNWRLYHDPSTDRLVFMPHGLDQMLWKPEGSILPRFEGRVAQAVLEIPELRGRYFARIKELRERVFEVPKLTQRVQEIGGRIGPILAKVEGGDVSEHSLRVENFRNAIVRRGESLDRQLAHPIVPVQFDAAGFAAVAGWKSQVDFGAPSFSPSGVLTTKDSVQIAAHDGSTVGSWKAGIWLERGEYIVQGRIKTRGIIADPGDSRAGAGLQVQGTRVEQALLGDSDWKSVELPFSVKDTLAETQVACEFRGAAGEAWFDLDSFRIKRVEPKTPK